MAAPPSAPRPPRQRALDAPTQLTPEVASHRKPARRFHLIGVFVLVLGAVAGGYLGFGRDTAPKQTAPLSVDAQSVLPVDNITDEKTAGRTLAKAKAEAAAAAEAERVRKANEVASRSQPRTPAPNVPASCNEFSGNRALGCAIMVEAGFGLDQMGCLDTVDTRSGWNERWNSGARPTPHREQDGRVWLRLSGQPVPRSGGSGLYQGQVRQSVQRPVVMAGARRPKPSAMGCPCRIPGTRRGLIGQDILRNPGQSTFVSGPQVIPTAS
jgi:hypothetical protein